MGQILFQGMRGPYIQLPGEELPNVLPGEGVNHPSQEGDGTAPLDPYYLPSPQLVLDIRL